MSLDINAMFNSMANAVNQRADDLQTRMSEITSSGQELDQTQLLELQFQVGQYNAMLEMTSTISKALTDEAKQIAQRTN